MQSTESHIWTAVACWNSEKKQATYQLWDLRFSRRWGCCVFWRRIDSSVDANASQKHAVWILRAEGGDSMFLPNAGIYRRVYTAPKPRRTSTCQFLSYRRWWWRHSSWYISRYSTLLTVKCVILYQRQSWKSGEGDDEWDSGWMFESVRKRAGVWVIDWGCCWGEMSEIVRKWANAFLSECWAVANFLLPKNIHYSVVNVRLKFISDKSPFRSCK
jgi:hypothetical protein